jgi:hypothetical protein
VTSPYARHLRARARPGQAVVDPQESRRDAEVYAPGSLPDEPLTRLSSSSNMRVTVNLVRCFSGMTWQAWGAGVHLTIWYLAVPTGKGVGCSGCN